MKFDVIIGNPPYHLTDAKGKFGASPIYHEFVQQAKKLDPKYITMIIPSRWMITGKGLGDFRNEMLNDKRLKKIIDYYDSEMCFNNVKIGGGVCYFLWYKNHKGNCEITTVNNLKTTTVVRPLLEKGLDFFIRDNNAISIVRKVIKFEELSFSENVSSSKPFGLRTFFKGTENKMSDNDVLIYQRGGVGYVSENAISKNNQLINKYKVLSTGVYGDGGKTIPNQVINKPLIAPKNSCCTETYVVLGSFDTEEEAINMVSYIQTKFFRFLVSLLKITQHATSKVYKLVPNQDFSKPWTDEELYEKYGLTQEEIDYIESMIRPMRI